jgi:hypothetical protein
LEIIIFTQHSTLLYEPNRQWFAGEAKQADLLEGIRRGLTASKQCAEYAWNRL